MEHRNPRNAVLAILVLAFGLSLQGAAFADEKTTATQPMAKTGKVQLRAYGSGEPVCDSNTYAPVDPNNNQTVSIAIDKSTVPPSIEFTSDKCVMESAKGSLTFTVAGLPANYKLEIDFQSRRDGGGKAHKGPFKHKDMGDLLKYPVAGRCMMRNWPTDLCVFDEDDKSIPNKETFQFFVYLWDQYGNLADERDPGVMVIDN